MAVRERLVSLLTEIGDAYQRFAECQFVLYDDDQDTVLAEGNTMSCAWDGTHDALGPGIDDTMTNAVMLYESRRSPNTLCALAAKIPPQHQNERPAPVVLTGACIRGRNTPAVPRPRGVPERVAAAAITRHAPGRRGLRHSIV